MRIIVSPMVPFDPTSLLTDVFMFDSSALGALIVDEDVTTEDFNDPARDIQRVKLRERYALAILHEGLGIAKMGNVHVVPNRVVLPAQAVVNDLSTVSALASVLG